ncbi:MAG: HPr kinase/phosphatase C-terminal domain-containing protein [Enhydrobacter sp.]|nr:MAG: HPr kinase/phosphatase C-terminal domain-containing protein [Enhydrobacter sp.]
MFIHATTVAFKSTGGSWRAALLRGPSGSGKSDLALRALEAGGRLVADDQTHVARKGRGLIATPPAALAGMIEVRGLGIVRLGRMKLLSRAAVGLLVDLVPADRIDRLPEARHEALLGVDLPVLALAPFEASAAAKLRLALARTARA